MDSITDNVRRVREQIAEAALRAGRKPEDIFLVAASKTKDAQAVREAVRAGVDACGENRVNEFLEKDAQGAYEGAPKHFIGRLQHNKVRLITGKADLIQSVDSPELLEMLEKRAALLDTVQPILLQVNIGREETKGGFPPEAADEAAAMAAALPHLRLEGLMAIPPAWEKGGGNWPGAKNYPYFDEMYRLYIDIAGKKYDNAHIWCLSMGMSGDFAQAIVSGSNMVRVGSAIFGARTALQP
ncbi:MAG: YggS family pyridoxal phosphate-dependent enzyme [Oscillospiraceae bacterium]|jgi:pyridoxal phosphate enzyme (YggS family)|nr:YggS family pyridoxal phosphate-dependent enzyme [Oscillospiraceae bacterium]